MTWPDIEEWRPVRGAETRYEVSSLGGVRSYLRRGGGQKLWSDPVRLRGTDHQGYRLVAVDGRSRLVHRLVAEAFHGPAPAGADDCRHLNGNRSDNRASNLAWGTRRENERDKVRHGRSNRGERCGNAKLTAVEVLEIRSLYASGEWLQRELGLSFGVRQDTISLIVNRRSWAHVA